MNEQGNQRFQESVDERIGHIGIECYLIGDEIRARIFAHLLAGNDERAEGLGEALRLIVRLVERHFAHIPDDRSWGGALQIARDLHAAHYAARPNGPQDDPHD